MSDLRCPFCNTACIGTIALREHLLICEDFLAVRAPLANPGADIEACAKELLGNFLIQRFRDGTKVLRPEIEAILRRHSQERTGWQPIETAPKDGRDILVWSSGSGNWPRMASWVKDYWALDSANLGIPTHWMPLPAAPKAPTGKP